MTLHTSPSRRFLSAILLSLALPAAASAQVVAEYKFDQEGFGPGCSAFPREVVDTSGFGNHACVTQGRLELTDDAWSGSGALRGWHPDNDHLHADNPFSNIPGGVTVPYDASLFPATGRIDAMIRLESYPSSNIHVFHNTTFHWVNTEPEDMAPEYILPGHDTPVGRSVYWLMVQPDGSVSGLIGNDDPCGGPWTHLQTAPGSVPLGVWTAVAVEWDGRNLTVEANGQSVTTTYTPVTGLGLSYQGTAIHPTAGPIDAYGTVAGGEYMDGTLDEVKLTAIPPVVDLLDPNALVESYVGRQCDPVAIVDAICPCDGPYVSEWANHGEYRRCVQEVTQRLIDEGELPGDAISLRDFSEDSECAANFDPHVRISR